MNLIDKFSRTQPCAFACGINLTLCVLWSLACNAARMVSRDGRCKTFDRAADGYVRSEASGVLHLCGNALNVCTHDVSSPQRGIQIIAISSNQDGRSSALTAPNGPAQQDAIRSCLLICGVDPLQFSTLQTSQKGCSRRHLAAEGTTGAERTVCRPCLSATTVFDFIPYANVARNCKVERSCRIWADTLPSRSIYRNCN